MSMWFGWGSGFEFRIRPARRHPPSPPTPNLGWVLSSKQREQEGARIAANHPAQLLIFKPERSRSRPWPLSHAPCKTARAALWGGWGGGGQSHQTSFSHSAPTHTQPVPHLSCPAWFRSRHAAERALRLGERHAQMGGISSVLWPLLDRILASPNLEAQEILR